MRVRLLVCVLLVGLLLGCSTAPTPEAAVQPPESQPTPTAPGATATPSPQPTATPEPTATPTPTPTPPQVGVRIPAEVQQGLDALGIALPETLAAEGRDAQVAVVADGEAAVTLALTPLQQAPAAAPARYLAAVSPFRGLRDEVTSAELAAA